MSSRRTGCCVSDDVDPAGANVAPKPSTISADTAANTAASRRRAPPKSIPASTIPAHTIPIQVSLTLLIASMNASPFGPPVAPS
jgi:hypothetical protein